MTLDDIENLASMQVDTMDPDDGVLVADVLARAVLAMLPVIRAAESARKFADEHPYGSRGDDGLDDALDTLHTALSADGRMGEGR